MGIKMDYILINLEKKILEWILRHRPILGFDEFRKWNYFNFLKFDHKRLWYYEFEERFYDGDEN